MNAFTLGNVRYDENSEFFWGELNESDFVRSTLLQVWKLMGDDFENYFFYVFSNHNRGRTPESQHHITSRKKVLIYVSDEIGSDPSIYASNYFAIFKAYIGKGNFAHNVFPFPLGYVNGVPSFNVEPINQRKINLFFRGNLNTNRIDFYRTFSNFSFLLPPARILTHKIYKCVLLWLQRDFSKLFPSSVIIFNRNFKDGYSLAEYGKVLSESKIVLSPKGFNSSECFRLFEAMRAGCIIISEKLPAVFFYANSPIIQIQNWKDGIRIAKELLKDPQRMHQLQQETIAWWESVCSEKATAAYILSKLNSLNSEGS
jgi:hypothetical protein